jgi:exonuclease SbcD
MSVRLLALGDLHLGRRISRVPGRVRDTLDGLSLSPEGALLGAVEQAKLCKVDAVVFCGDVVDREEDFFEAHSILVRAMRALEAAGIPVYAVAGNHDVDVLPRLSRSVPGFHLLGENGVWECVSVVAQEHVDDGTATVTRLLGWSFPQPKVVRSPLDSLPSSSQLEAWAQLGPIIGVVHGDRDRPRSEHAPLSGARLDQAPVDAWLLGHIHVPDRLEGQRPMGYLGSMIGLDPSETGPRGPWLVDVQGPGRVNARQLGDAALRWEAATVLCDDAQMARQSVETWLDDQLLVRVPGQLADAMGASTGVKAIGCRITIVGRTNYHKAIEAYLGRFTPESHDLEHAGMAFFFDRVVLRTQSIGMVERLARADDVLGLLAAKLLVLDRAPSDPERQRLVSLALERVDEINDGAAYATLPGRSGGHDARAVVEQMRESGWRALEAMLAQTQGDGVSAPIGQQTAPQASPRED